MKSVRPKRFDVRGIKLTPEEGFVLSRVDGPLSLRELVTLTGLEEGRVTEIVTNLAAQGAVEVEGDAAPANADAVAALLAAYVADTGKGSDSDADADADADTDADSDSDTDSDADTDAGSGTDTDSSSSSADSGTDSVSVSDSVYESDADAVVAAGSAPDAEPAAAADPEEARAHLGEREYRKIYESIYRPQTRDARAAAAQRVDGGHLMALCFDAEPQVILAVLSNPKAGLDHARAIAFYHRTSAGLEICARRSEHLSDTMVQRRMLRNPQLPDTVLRRIVHPKMLLEVYRISVDREIPERSRVKVRELFRKKFMLASADERAALLIKTEGRALLYLAGCPLDAHTTQILCGKTTYTVLFVQNIARFSAAPPVLLAHLLKQPIVRRNLGLRKMILQHHNTPAEAKKNL